MFSNLGCHVHKFPSGRYGFVGSIPVTLGKQIPATYQAVMGCRAFKNEAGETVEWKFPTFDDEQAARDHADSCGITLSN